MSEFSLGMDGYGSSQDTLFPLEPTDLEALRAIQGGYEPLPPHKSLPGFDQLEIEFVPEQPTGRTAIDDQFDQLGEPRH